MSNFTWFKDYLGNKLSPYTNLDAVIDTTGTTEKSLRDIITEVNERIDNINTDLDNLPTIPIPINISQLNNDKNFIVNTVNNLTNYYLKTESYSKEEVNNLISNIVTLNVLPVQTLPTENISQTTIYLVPKSDGKDNDIHNEYINKNGTVDGWELIGNTSIDLSNYYTKAEINDLLDNKVDKEDGMGLSSTNFTPTEKNKLLNIADGANKTIVDVTLSSTSTNPVQNKAINFALISKANSSDIPTKVSQFENDSGYITSSDIDISQNHVHANKTILDKITQTLLDGWNSAVAHISNKSNPHAVTKAQIGLGDVVNQKIEIATTSKAGIVKPDGDTIIVQADGTIKANRVPYTYTMPIPINSNLNNFSTPGFYCSHMNSISESLINSPTEKSFYMTVGYHAGRYQEVTEYITVNPKKYMRNYYGDTWGTWYRIYTTADPPPITNNLLATISGNALDATQGKILDDKIGSLNSLTTEEKNNLASAINEIDAICNGLYSKFSNYLPLTGGVLTTSVSHQLTLKRAEAGNTVGLNFVSGTTSKGLVGFAPGGEFIVGSNILANNLLTITPSGEITVLGKKLLKESDGIKVIPISPNSSMNDYYKAGFYDCAFNNLNGILSDRPTNEQFSMIVGEFHSTSNGAYQLVIENKTLPKMFFRIISDTIKGDWHRIYTTVDKPTAVYEEIILNGTLTFADKICKINNGKIFSSTLADVYFTADTIDIATEADITVDTYTGYLTLTAQNVPTGTIKATIVIKGVN